MTNDRDGDVFADAQEAIGRAPAEVNLWVDGWIVAGLDEVVARTLAQQLIDAADRVREQTL